MNRIYKCNFLVNVKCFINSKLLIAFKEIALKDLLF